MLKIDAHPTRRGVFRLESQIVLPVRRDQIFEFFSDATQLQAITPPWLHFSIETPTPIRMFPGTLIDYRLRLRGIPIRWRTRITDWQPPHQFVDEQIRGPYRLWRHTHTFEDLGQEGTFGQEVM